MPGAEEKPAEASKATDAAEAPTPVPEHVAIYSEIKGNIAALEKAVASKEARIDARLMKHICLVRRRMNLKALVQVVSVYFPDGHSMKQPMLDLLQKVEEQTEMTDSGEASKKAKPAPRSSITPETEVYAELLVLMLLVDRRSPDALSFSQSMFTHVQQWHNRRTVDALAAKVYFFYSLCHEKAGKKLYQGICSPLMALFRSVCLHHNEPGQAMVANLLLRNYLTFDQYEQADKFVAKTSFPESASSAQLARYYFYIGRIKAVQLDYSEAQKSLTQAQRKAPATGSFAFGFRATVLKYNSVVLLLTGEVPEREPFEDPVFARALAPYYALVKAVREGDINNFGSLVQQYVDTFKADKTLTLVMRLRQSVIKTALRNISLAYSRISVADICAKLKQESVEDTESMLAKAIRDGVIDAQIDHAAGVLHSKEAVDAYSSNEPHSAFHRRINFCLNTHNEAVKAMRYPPAEKKDLEDAEKAKERRAEESDIAAMIAEDEEEDF